VQALFITQGSPWENGYSERFNGRLRDELSDRELFDTLWEVKISWNTGDKAIIGFVHSALGYRPPAPEIIMPQCI